MSGFSPEQMRQLIEEGIPFNKYLGLKARTLSADVVELMLPFRPEFIGDPLRPALHGGIISMLIDTTGGMAAWMNVGDGERVSTVDLVVDYLLPGPAADILARAHVVRRGNRVCTANVNVVRVDDDDKAVIAQGRGVYNIHKKPP